MRNDEYSVIFCQNIKALREKNSISKKKMAEIWGIGLTSLSKIEQNILPPRLKVDIISKLSKHFKIKSYKLFDLLP